MKVIIAGGGIGGLTTALMLHARNMDVQVYETAATIREAGVGINILPHAIRELEGLGLLGVLACLLLALEVDLRRAQLGAQPAAEREWCRGSSAHGPAAAATSTQGPSLAASSTSSALSAT